METTARIEGDGYRIENVVYESRPGLFVTANLYLPAKPKKSTPAVLFSHSHHNPKTQGELQDMGMTWARQGWVVLVPDHLGHGERRQHPFASSDQSPKPFQVGRQDYYFRYNTGLQLQLAGESLIGWMAWDLMRGVDLLCTLENVDKDRIILIGAVAGGGDPAGVAAALNPRIAAFKAGHRQNGDLLGFKFGVWEDGHRVPMIVRWPGKVKAGTTSKQLIGNIDMLATLAAVTGQKLNKAQQADSVNMLPALPAIVGEPDKPIRDHLVLAPNKGTHLSVRKGKWMYIPRQGSGGFGGRTPGSHTFAGPPAASFVGSVNSDIEDGKIKADAPPAQLYDLVADVNETKNVINEHPDEVQELKTLLASYAPVRSGIRQNSRGNRGKGTSGEVHYKPAKKIAAVPSTRSASFDFESGKLEPWKIVQGKFGHIIGSRSEFFRINRPYNKHDSASQAAPTGLVHAGRIVSDRCILLDDCRVFDDAEVWRDLILVTCRERTSTT